MSTVAHSSPLVNTLREAFAITDRRCFCQCGKFCPTANACIPVAGPVHSPYYTIIEREHAGRRRWSVVLFDPQTARLYPLNSQWHTSPCQAARAGLRMSMEHSPRRPLRLDLAGRHGETTIDWSVLELQLAEGLVERGRVLATGATPKSFAHPLIEAGYYAALNGAALDGQPRPEGPRPATAETYTWALAQLVPDLAEVR